MSHHGEEPIDPPVQVRILSSPYSDVKRGERGRAAAVKHRGTRYEVYRVLLSGGRSRLFHLDELERKETGS